MYERSGIGFALVKRAGALLAACDPEQEVP